MATLSCTGRRRALIHVFFFICRDTLYFLHSFLFTITISTMTQRWVGDSDTNPAHALLEELFLEKKISSSTTAGKLQPKYPEFKKFSKDVLRNVFRQMKAKYGVSCKFCVIIFFRQFCNSDLFIYFLILVVPFGKQNPLGHDEASNSSSTGAGKRKKVELNEDDDEEEGEEGDDSDAAIIHVNQPVQTVVFREPQSRVEKVLILAALPGGVTDASFSLDGIGPGTRTGKITYRWPYTLIDYDRIFSEEIENRFMTKEHPKVEALKQELENKRNNIDSPPEAFLKIDLPIPVQTDKKSISIPGKRIGDGGTTILEVELTAFQSLYTMSDRDQKAVFSRVL